MRLPILKTARERMGRGGYLAAVLVVIPMLALPIFLFGLRSYFSVLIYVASAFVLATASIKRLDDIGWPFLIVIIPVSPAIGVAFARYLDIMPISRYWLEDGAFLGTIIFDLCLCLLPGTRGNLGPADPSSQSELFGSYAVWVVILITAILRAYVFYFSGIAMALILNPGLLFGDA